MKWDLADGAYIRFGRDWRDHPAITVYAGGSEPYESSVEIPLTVARELIAALEEFVRRTAQ